MTNTVVTDPKKITELLTRGVDEVIDKKNLKKKLLSGKKLRIKLGIDPTGPKLHLGQSIPLLKLRDFQELGHQIVLIIGDFTGLVGDTSDKNSERLMLDQETIKKNMKSYIEQFKLILDMTKVEVDYNSEWLLRINFYEICQIADLFSVHEFIARENIKLRMNAGKRIVLREVLYPLMQGYDSVAVHADVEIGGTDQRFNLLAGRKIQPIYGQEGQDILMNPLILGPDGEKMSTSRGNTINMLDLANDQYGKIMSVKDELILDYFENLTRIPRKIISDYKRALFFGKNPRDIKMALARTITEIYHGKEKAREAEMYFVDIFQKGELPAEIEEVVVAKKSPVWRRKSDEPICEDVPALLVETRQVASKSAARRLIEQKAVRIDGALFTDWKAEIAVYDGMIVQIGKKRFTKIKIK